MLYNIDFSALSLWQHIKGKKLNLKCNLARKDYECKGHGFPTR